MPTNKELIQQFFTELQQGVRNNIPSVTGATRAAIRTNVGDSIGQLIGPAYIDALEIGRGPTRNSSPQTPTLREKILQWIRAKGIQRDDISDESLAFLISRSIHKKGTRLFQSGRNSGVISNVITQDAIDRFGRQLTDANVQNFSSRLLARFNEAFQL